MLTWGSNGCDGYLADRDDPAFPSRNRVGLIDGATGTDKPEDGSWPVDVSLPGPPSPLRK